MAIECQEIAPLIERPISEMLALFPRGATDDQLIWRLGMTGIRIDASELLAGLNKLAQRGEIVRDVSGRWRATPFALTPISRTAEVNAAVRAADSADVLYAVTATCRSRIIAPVTDTNELQSAASLPEWSNLVSYYASTQRKDPRGQIEEFADRHGRVWQLFRANGEWWTDTYIQIKMEALPGKLREALSRRKTISAAIGWPVSLFPTPEGSTLIPGLILPVDFRIESADLILDVDDSEPTVNPAWLREVRRHTSWSESALLEQLFPEGEAADLGSVSERMRHALATIDGAVLRPADLASEITLSGKGLRNTAALFLPEDGAFTKGTAEDLEAIRDWTREARSGTALEALFAATASSTVSSETPLLPIGSEHDLTDNQMEAAEAALTGPLTVIQGPPGTGKSQVIVSLIISAVMSGRSVLFAAKNHQAIDEVERRIREIVPDAPLLTRGRDAEGERDNSFLDAIFDVAHGEIHRTDESRRVEHARTTIVAYGRGRQEQRRTAREISGLNISLSELAERTASIHRHISSPLRRPVRKSWFATLLGKFRHSMSREADLTTPLPEQASMAQIEHRRTALRSRLGAIDADGAVSADSPAATDPMGERIKSFLPKFAQIVTRPNDLDWRQLSERAKELEFAQTKSARRLPAEDARAVLRYRPVWAVSTLSVPSRIPLTPALFDYVIFDEASQCDVASALPLFARARNAVVVGDPMQLRFVPQLGKAAEHALMDAAGLPKIGRASIAQSINSLFDFCERRPGATRVFLADQFRSSPPIIDYLNADFYNGKLVGRRPGDHFRVPLDYRAGLAWEDVAGHAIQHEGGTINRAEVKQIVDILLRISADADFSGSVGVISPFNSQVAELQRAIRAALPQTERDRLSLRIATVDKFQGGEADIILFSLVLAVSAPRSTWTFLQKERRRLNVAISRARALCMVIGDLSYARKCGIRHIEFLAKCATTPWSPHRPQQFDSDWERRLDTAMRSRGLDPIPQYPVGTRYLDFALDPDGVKLDIEVDGRQWHTDASGGRKVSDRLRDAELRSRGWRVLRLWVHELEADMEGCLDRIELEIADNRNSA